MTIPQALEIAIQHHQAGRRAEAEQLYRQILALEPQHPDALHLLGLIAQQAGAIEAATELVRAALAANPAVPIFHNSLGNLLADQGQFDGAVAAYRRALELEPDLAGAHSNLAGVLSEQGRLPAAITAYRRALELKPGYAMAHNNLGHALHATKQLDEALAAYRRALEIEPDFALALNNLGNVLKDLGRPEEGLACHRRAVVAPAVSPFIHSNLLAVLHYSPETTLAQIFEAHTEFDRRQAASFRAGRRPHKNSRDPDRPLRLGFVSPHFAFHPVGHFLVRCLENLDRLQFAAVCYSDTPASDGMTARLRAATTAWHEVAGLSDEALADRIRGDDIDILFDLAGHTAGNRLLVFARKPAPIQITWLDYVGTTGLSTIDYLIADLREIPPESERWYREKVLRMPDDYICYDPPTDAPAVGPLPALTCGHVTFASFNLPAKTTPEIVGVWAKILARVPDARLVLKNRGFDHSTTRRHYQQCFAEEGVAANRVELRGWSPPSDVLASYNQVDIALDTFPYNGGLTTCEAMWMGVPVVTCPGETFASRHGLAHLTAVGATETIAANLDEYVDLAVALANDLPRLASLRAGLRSRVAASPLCDGKRFAGHFASLLREVWTRWASGRGGTD